MAKPGNIILQNFSGTVGGVYSPTPIVNNAAALVYYIKAEATKKLEAVIASVSRNPFVASGGIYSALVADSSRNTEIFGRLTIFRDFSQDPSNLFDPYFDISYTNALPPPNTFDYYGPRVDYTRDNAIVDVVISKIDQPVQIDMHGECFSNTERLTIVLSPFYDSVLQGGVVPLFAQYTGDGLVRTLSAIGCQSYGLA